MVYFWFTIANEDSGMVSIIIFGILESFQMLTKFALEPLCTAEMLLETQETTNSFANMVFLYI